MVLFVLTMLFILVVMACEIGSRLVSDPDLEPGIA